MKRRGTELPPPAEVACLRALWAGGELSVKEVQRFLSSTHPLAYTTVLTLLERLVRRGIVSKRRAGRGFLYRSMISKGQLRELALQQVLELYFDGSKEELLQHLNSSRMERRFQNTPESSLDTSPLDTTLL